MRLKKNTLEKLLLIGGIMGSLVSAKPIYEILAIPAKKPTIEMSRVLEIGSQFDEFNAELKGIRGFSPAHIKQMGDLKQEYDSLLAIPEIKEENDEINKNQYRSFGYGLLISSSLAALVGYYGFKTKR